MCRVKLESVTLSVTPDFGREYEQRRALQHSVFVEQKWCRLGELNT